MEEMVGLRVTPIMSVRCRVKMEVFHNVNGKRKVSVMLINTLELKKIRDEVVMKASNSI